MISYTELDDKWGQVTALPAPCNAGYDFYADVYSEK